MEDENRDAEFENKLLSLCSLTSSREKNHNTDGAELDENMDKYLGARNIPLRTLSQRKGRIQETIVLI